MVCLVSSRGGSKIARSPNQLETLALRLRIVSWDFLECDGECTKTPSSVLFDVLLELVFLRLCLIPRAQVDDDAGHSLGHALELPGGFFAVRYFRALVDRVEWFEVKEFDTSSSNGGVAQSLYHGSIDRILVLSSRGICSEKNDLVWGEVAVCLDGIPVDSELVRRERASLVGAQDGHSGQLLDGGDTRDDSFVLRQLCGPDRKSHRKDSRHSDGDPSDEEHQNVVQPTTVLEPEPSIENENFSDDEDADGDKTEGADLRKNLLQVACSIVILAHKRGRASEESVGTSGNDNAFSFALLASGPTKFKVSHLRLHADAPHSRETLIAGFLVLGKRLARQSSLVNGDVDRLDKSTVSGDDVSYLERNHVSGNKNG